MKEFYTMTHHVGVLLKESCLLFSGVKLFAYPPQLLKIQSVTDFQEHCESVSPLLSAPRADLFGVYLHQESLTYGVKGFSRFTP